MIGITKANSPIGKGAKFSGSSYIEIKDSESLDLDRGFTFSVWAYRENIAPKTVQPIITKLENGFDKSYASYMLCRRRILNTFIKMTRTSW